MSCQVEEMYFASSKCNHIQGLDTVPQRHTMALHPYPLYVAEFSDDHCVQYGLHGATYENLPLQGYMEKVRLNFTARAC